MPLPLETPVWKVTEITRVVRDLLEGQIGEIWVEGEISNHRKQASGHQYFTLKDERSQLACVHFHRPGLRYQTIPLRDGMQVQVRGLLSVYEARGQYQLTVQQVQAAGAGLLQARFDALKRALAAEGLFAPERKRPLPTFPLIVGVVTSPTGAAIRDMLTVLHRRAPWMHIVIYPARVQGEGAAEEITRGIEFFNEATAYGMSAPDLIVTARGGGSIEDLWAFNEERVARAIYESEIPVVSAVGHEIDFTIADFVADLRAATPSAAAELIAPDTAAMLRRLGDTTAWMSRRLAQALESGWQRLDYASTAVAREMRQRSAVTREQLRSWSAIIRQHRPDRGIAMRREQLLRREAALQERWEAHLHRQRQRVNAHSSMLRVLSPLATLERGYSITLDAAGAVIRTTSAVQSGEKITTRLGDGSVASRVE